MIGRTKRDGNFITEQQDQGSIGRGGEEDFASDAHFDGGDSSIGWSWNYWNRLVLNFTTFPKLASVLFFSSNWSLRLASVT